MASVSGSSNGYTLTLSVTQSSQSIATNTSTLSWTLTFSCGSYYYQNSNTVDGFSASINGTSVYSANKVIWFSGSRTSVTIASGSTTVSHNADGSKAVSLSCSYWPGKTASYYPAYMNGSGSMTLTTIPRASSFGTISGSTLGSSMTINISRNSSGFTHHLWYSMGSVTWTQIGTGIGTSVSFTPPLSLCSQIPNATSGTLRFMLRTYNGSNLVGSDVFKDITVSVPSSVVPTVSSVSVSEATSGLAAQFGGYVQGYSRLSTSVNASGSYGSTIKTYSTTIEGVNYTSRTFTSGVLRSSGSITISSKVTDSRGRTSAAKSTTVSVIAYSTPKITSFTAQRCLADGTLDDDGTCVKATFNCSISPVNNKNNKLVTLQYLNGSTWTNLNQWTTAYSYNTSYTTEAIFTTDSSHDIRLIVADYFTSTSSQTSVQTAFTLMNFNASGKGLAIGKVSEKTNGFEIDLPMYDSYGTKITNGLAVYNDVGGSLQDPNKTTEYLILTNINIPSGNSFMYVYTMFYSSKSTASNRSQIAVPYGNNDSIYFRFTSNGSWMAWQRLIKSSEILDKTWPVNSYWIGHTHTSPASLIGGTWYRVQSRFLWGTTTSGTIGATAGEQTHTLTISEMPRHDHAYYNTPNSSGDYTQWVPTTSQQLKCSRQYCVPTGENAAHNNMPPYVNVAIWRRTA